MLFFRTFTSVLVRTKQAAKIVGLGCGQAFVVGENRDFGFRELLFQFEASSVFSVRFMISSYSLTPIRRAAMTSAESSEMPGLMVVERVMFFR